MQVSNVVSSYSFRQNAQKKYYKETAFPMFFGCVAALPLLDIIDGTSVKDAFKGLHAGKYIGGMLALGGLYAGSRLLTDEYVNNSKDIKKSRYIRATIQGGALGTLGLGVVDWALTSKKKIKSKWYALAAGIGTIAGFATTNMDTQ